MKSLKKYLDLILLGTAFLLIVLIFATMAGDAFTVTTKIPFAGDLKATSNLYDVIKADGSNGLTITAFVFMILGLVGTLAAIAIKLGKIKVPFVKFIYFGLGLVMVLSGLFYFLTITQLDKDFLKLIEAAKGSISLGAGSIFSGLFGFGAGASLIGLGVLTK